MKFSTVIMMCCRRILVVILILFLSAYFVLPSPAQEKAGSVQVDLTAAERAFLAGKQLRLGVDSARPPFEFIDEKGVYSGISAGFMEACLQRLGIPFVLVPGLNVGAAMKKMQEGAIDVIPKISPDPERAKTILFTRSHATFASVIVTRQNVRAIKGLDDLAGLKVGVLKGLIVEASVKRDFPNLPIISLPDVRTALVELSSGQIDVYIDNMAIVSYNIGKLGLNNLKIAAQTPYNYDMAFGVRKDWPLLASALDKALASLSKQERSAITGRWITVEYEPGFDWKAYWKVYVPIVAALLIIILVVFIWNRSLRRVIRERERIQEELKENARLLEFRGTIKAKLSQISVDLQKATTIEELARTFLSQVASLTGAAYGVFFLMDEQKQLLQAVGGYGWIEEEGKSRQFRIGQGLVGQCAREKKPLGFNNSQGSNIRITWGGGQFDPRAILLMPILEQDKILAVIELGALQPFTPEQRTLLDELLPMVALNLLINQRNVTTQELLAKGQEQIAELGKARKATLNILEDLEVSKKETEATMKKINVMSQAVYDALVMIDGDGKVQFWNEGAVRLFGYSAEEAMGTDFHATVVSAEDQEKAHAGLRHFAATGQGVLFGATVETTAVNRAGLTFPVEVNLSPFQVGEKWFAVGTVRNITERKQAEKELKEHMEEMERFSRLTIDREGKMIQLKEEINTLLEQTGKEKKYKIVT
jgi:PAS domain S-box-containing protein